MSNFVVKIKENTLSMTQDNQWEFAPIRRSSEILNTSLKESCRPHKVTQAPLFMFIYGTTHQASRGNIPQIFSKNGDFFEMHNIYCLRVISVFAALNTAPVSPPPNPLEKKFRHFPI